MLPKEYNGKNKTFFKFQERHTMQFRTETYNATNYPNLAKPNTDPTSAAYGTITSQDSPRSWQLALRLSFSLAGSFSSNEAPCAWTEPFFICRP